MNFMGWMVLNLIWVFQLHTIREQSAWWYNFGSYNLKLSFFGQWADNSHKISKILLTNLNLRHLIKIADYKLFFNGVIMYAQFDGPFVKDGCLITLSKRWFPCLQDKKTTVRYCCLASRREKNKFNPCHPIEIKYSLCVYIVAGLIIWFICCCVQMEMRNRAEFKPVDVETNPSSKPPQQLVTNQQFKVRRHPIVSLNILWSKMWYDFSRLELWLTNWC